MKTALFGIVLLALLMIPPPMAAANPSKKSTTKLASRDSIERYAGLASAIEGLHYIKAGIDHQLDLQDSASEKSVDPTAHLGNEMLAAKQANSEYGAALGYYRRNVSMGIDSNGESAMMLEILAVLINNNKANIRILKKLLSSSTPGSRPMDMGDLTDQATTLRNSNDHAWGLVMNSTALSLHELVQCSAAPGGTCNRLGLTTAHRMELSQKLLNYWGDGVRQTASSRSIADAAAAQIYQVVSSTGFQSIDGSYLPGAGAQANASTDTYKFAH